MDQSTAYIVVFAALAVLAVIGIIQVRNMTRRK